MKKSFGKSTFNFNKQLVFGEIGALIAAPSSAYIVSKLFSSSPSVISAFAVVGSIIGAAILFLGTRIFDNSSEKDYAKKGLINDLKYFTPAAFLLTLILYYPALYLLSEKMLNEAHWVFTSVVFAQAVAFSLFLIGINLYRFALYKLFGKRI